MLPLVTVAAGLAIGVAFVRRQHRLAEPLIDLQLFKFTAFSATLVADALTFFANFVR